MHISKTRTISKVLHYADFKKNLRTIKAIINYNQLTKQLLEHSNFSQLIEQLKHSNSNQLTEAF